MKVLLHVSDLNQVVRMENNISNLLYENSSVLISVVINGEAVKRFIKDSKTVINHKVAYYICKNSLKSYEIDHLGLLDGVELTSSGVYKLALLQNEGYFYIKV